VICGNLRSLRLQGNHIGPTRGCRAVRKFIWLYVLAGLIFILGIVAIIDGEDVFIATSGVFLAVWALLADDHGPARRHRRSHGGGGAFWRGSWLLPLAGLTSLVGIVALVLGKSDGLIAWTGFCLTVCAFLANDYRPDGHTGTPKTTADP
jgi:hypothetical protein